MTTATPDPTYTVKNLPWPLILGLAAVALVRPLLSIVGVMHDLGKPYAPVLITVVISLIWIAAVGLSSVPNPVLTLVFAGLTYGLLSIVLSGVLSPILDGELKGPLATPVGVGVVAVLVTNALWGAVTGALAQLVRERRSPK
jgi:hypothetical protein